MSRARFEKLISERKRALEHQVMKLPLETVSLSKLAYVQGQYAEIEFALSLYRDAHRDAEDGDGL